MVLVALSPVGRDGACVSPAFVAIWSVPDPPIMVFVPSALSKDTIPEGRVRRLSTPIMAFTANESGRMRSSGSNSECLTILGLLSISRVGRPLGRI